MRVAEQREVTITPALDHLAPMGNDNFRHAGVERVHDLVHVLNVDLFC